MVSVMLHYCMFCVAMSMNLMPYVGKKALLVQLLRGGI